MTTFSLKVLALILMLIDHIGEFFPALPVYLRWLGRLSAPLFIFCVVQGVLNTSNKKKYLTRIYAFSAIMGVGNFILLSIFPYSAVEISNNIMSTIFYIALICFIDMENRRDKAHGKKLWMYFALSQAAIYIIYVIIAVFFNKIYFLGVLLNGILPNIITCEGGIVVIIMGYVLYKYSESSKKQALAYVIYCGVYLLISMFIVFDGNFANILNDLFYVNYQWMMVFSVFFMLAYNGKKGRGIKYLFYVFYPLHIWLLFIASNLINSGVCISVLRC